MERIRRAAGSTPALPLIQEFIRMMPDALVLGTGFFSLVTLSFSYGMFFVALLESLGIYHFLRTTNNRLGIVPLIPLRESLGARCRSGITTLSASSLSLFGGLVSPQFPSAPLFIMGVAGAYVLMSMQVLSRELEAMGKEFTTRYYVAQVAIPLLVLFLVAYRIFYACDSPGNALLSVVLGAIVGALLIEQNRRLFGESSLNLIGVPLLRQRTASGEKLYICPTQSKI